jgi:hypothetical protein
MKKLVLTLLSTALCTAIYADNLSEAVYKNQRNSELVLKWDSSKNDSGVLTGTFKTAVGDCKKDVGIPVPVTGYYNQNTITLSINFPHCKQVVSMVGNFNTSKDSLSTIWLNAKVAADSMHKDWNTNLIGMDTYQKI